MRRVPQVRDRDGRAEEAGRRSGAAALPVNSAAASAIKDPTVKTVQDFAANASYIQTYFDIALPTSAGQALDDAVANFFAGQRQRQVRRSSTPWQ